MRGNEFGENSHCSFIMFCSLSCFKKTYNCRINTCILRSVFTAVGVSLFFDIDCRLGLGTVLINLYTLWLKVIGKQRKLHNV